MPKWLSWALVGSALTLGVIVGARLARGEGEAARGVRD